MNPAKVVRESVKRFTDLPNIGPAAAEDFRVLGFSDPSELVGADPFELYQALCAVTGTRHDPCVLDTFISVTDFLNGNEPQSWWHFTAQRKAQYGQLQLAGVNSSLAANNSFKPNPLRGSASLRR